MNLADTAYLMAPAEQLAEAQRQFAMVEIADDFLAWFYERSGWFLLLCWASSTAASGVKGPEHG